MNAVAHAMLTLPAHKGQYAGVGGAASRGMRVKAFYVLLARAPESDDDGADDPYAADPYAKYYDEDEDDDDK